MKDRHGAYPHQFYRTVEETGIEVIMLMNIIYDTSNERKIQGVRRVYPMGKWSQPGGPGEGLLRVAICTVI